MARRRLSVAVALALLLFGAAGIAVSARPGDSVEDARPAGLIVFTRGPAGDRASLYVVEVAGGRPRLLVRRASSAAVSADGNRLAFVRGSSIWIAARDGSQQRSLTRPPASRDEWSPAWSSDGRTLFFTREDSPHSWSIHSVRLDGTGVRRLTEGAPRWADIGGQSEAAPAPGGDIVAYSEWSHGGGDDSLLIGAMTASGGPAKLGFALSHASHESGPAWAPDGRKLAFVAFDQSDEVGPSGIYVSSSATTGPRRIVRPPHPSVSMHSPAWSTDGHWIAFTRDSEIPRTVTQIWLVRPDGTGLRRLTSGKADAEPVWLGPN